MAAITVQQLVDAALDIAHTTAQAISEQEVVYDRRNVPKLTTLGASNRMGRSVQAVEAAALAAKSAIQAKLAIIALVKNKGDWAASTLYAVHDIVYTNATWYICLVAHTSSAIFATDTAGNKWGVYQVVSVEDLVYESQQWFMDALAANVVEEATGAEVANGADKVVTAEKLLSAMALGFNTQNLKIGLPVAGKSQLDLTQSDLFVGLKAVLNDDSIRDIAVLDIAKNQILIGGANYANGIKSTVSFGKPDNFADFTTANGDQRYVGLPGGRVLCVGRVLVPVAGLDMVIPYAANLTAPVACCENANFGGGASTLIPNAQSYGGNHVALSHNSPTPVYMNYQVYGMGV